MKAKRIRFPITVKRGSSTVKIYRDRKPEATYYRVAYHIGGKRHRLHFRNLEIARSEAEAKASQLSRGDIDAAQLTGRDRLVYGRALDAVKQFDLPLDGVAIEYADARKLLTTASAHDGVSLIDAVRFYARHHHHGIKRKPVSDALEDFIAAKARKGVSDVYLSDLRYRLGAFSKAFHCDVSALTPDDVARFFLHLDLSPCSHNNFMRTLRTFLGFAQRHGWLSKEIDLLEKVEQRTEKRAPVEIFTPDELNALLQEASADIAPAIALGAFAGLRSAEILRLEWSDLERHQGFVEIGAHKAKMATRRIVPIADNLAKWLALAPRASTRVWPHSKHHFFEAQSRTARSAKLKWKQNALRHSFISYRLALVQDMNRVALEAGNSPAMIFRHYRELCTPEQARTWFSIAPDPVSNIVPISRRKSSV
jgi:integrase